MKFTRPTLALALLFPLLAAAQAQCDGCDTSSLDAIGVCTHPWIDKIVTCMNAPCNVVFKDDPRLQCEGDLGDGSIDSGNSTSTTTTATGSVTNDSDLGTLFPMPTIINDIDPSTAPHATGTFTPTTTSSSKANGTTTTSGPKSTESGGAAAPAFSGIGFGGGAAAMVGLAGLVGLVL